MAALTWLRPGSDGSVTVTLRVQPGASRTEAAGLHGDALKLRLAAPPVDGKANTALIAWFAEFMVVPKSAIDLLAGAASRKKIIRITAVTPERLARLQALA